MIFNYKFSEKVWGILLWGEGRNRERGRVGNDHFCRESIKMYRL